MLGRYNVVLVCVPALTSEMQSGMLTIVRLLEKHHDDTTNGTKAGNRDDEPHTTRHTQASRAKVYVLPHVTARSEYLNRHLSSKNSSSGT